MLYRVDLGFHVFFTTIYFCFQDFYDCLLKCSSALSYLKRAAKRRAHQSLIHSGVVPLDQKVDQAEQLFKESNQITARVFRNLFFDYTKESRNPMSDATVTYTVIEQDGTISSSHPRRQGTAHAAGISHSTRKGHRRPKSRNNETYSHYNAQWRPHAWTLDAHYPFYYAFKEQSAQEIAARVLGNMPKDQS